MHYLLILSWYWEILTCVKSCFWSIQLSTSVNLGHLTDSDPGWVLSVSEYEPKITNYSELNFFNQFSIFWLIQLNSTVEFTWARFIIHLVRTPKFLSPIPPTRKIFYAYFGQIWFNKRWQALKECDHLPKVIVLWSDSKPMSVKL